MYHIFQYNTTRDEWSQLPLHHADFAMAQFIGNLIIAGKGCTPSHCASVSFHCRPQVFCHRCCAMHCGVNLFNGTLLTSGVTNAVPLWWCTAVNGTLLTSGVTTAVPLWWCTAVNLFSGTLGVLSPVGGGLPLMIQSVSTVLCVSLTILVQKATLN